MSTADLKIDLINKITNLKEVHIIEEIQKLLDFELEKGIFQLSDKQQSRLIEAKTDRTLSESQANNDIEEWLTGK